MAWLLGELGARVIDADQVAREVVEPGSPLLCELRVRFGDQIFNHDGRLSRAQLASLAFSDPQLRLSLESIMHPPILKRIRCLISAPGPEPAVVIDAPLLIESGLHAEVDQVWVVTAPRHIRLERLQGRGGLSPEQAIKRMDSQLSDRDRNVHAHVIIDNGGSWSSTERQVGEAWDRVGRANCGDEPGSGDKPDR